MTESADVVVVGSRCAGSAAAITLARRGRKVIALDSAAFPSDTLSTHLFFPHHWAELERLGARERVLRLDPPLHTHGVIGTPDTEIAGRMCDYEGIAAGSCVRRPGLDLALVETARAAGAEVRERVRVTGLLRDRAGRVHGVRHRGRDGTEGELHAALVIGADGRRSTVAKLVGARRHHHRDNQRAMVWAYYADPRPEARHLAVQSRREDDLVSVFPCDGGQALVLLMPPAARAAAFRADPEGQFEATLDRFAQVRQRLDGGTRVSRLRASYEHPSYFRHSHGPGWALAGDAGHFKDPVTAQGIRDALRFGRLLGEAVAAHLDRPAGLDAALARWEDDRDAQCLPMYQWANLLGRADPVSPIEQAAYRWLQRKPDGSGATELSRIFARVDRPAEVFNARNALRWTAAALRDPRNRPGDVATTFARDTRREVARALEAALFRRTRTRSARSGADA
ncbi:NAD(P)/FAD-dependent oxidoreductase [Amycolatopsis sp. PS_44_ISF1]|uniref:NAD(P)/FAD-dependent oxidoreductase n=1 Tax=Amycolatopsis sp. PS_44_ISF1 TaxID=2974917 RepID=UPI0028E06408|nr:NAD(P)/FAD-dependent oxidoreductase [Amycolatopsis sp. PS_44_ISF1]MDT8912995.1 NAD(P)/FAD-dependent oxidoreductase [Amycolatopsis sp. PS_44_ISF1]